MHRGLRTMISARFEVLPPPYTPSPPRIASIAQRSRAGQGRRQIASLCQVKGWLLDRLRVGAIHSLQRKCDRGGCHSAPCDRNRSINVDVLSLQWARNLVFIPGSDRHPRPSSRVPGIDVEASRSFPTCCRRRHILGLFGSLPSRLPALLQLVIASDIRSRWSKNPARLSM